MEFQQEGRECVPLFYEACLTNMVRGGFCTGTHAAAAAAVAQRAQGGVMQRKGVFEKT